MGGDRSDRPPTSLPALGRANLGALAGHTARAGLTAPAVPLRPVGHLD
ncbi:hypothetical protein JNW91_08375 [Micromonospora sp. STR1_7]|uniref:Uncharacterized protein n=1 Tax=Micromonospora parastrephiae TaxID=2806101 RepID=A0ABS1XRI5_9ACTN|nr:hypothetical protein [Micromonospora parastrephiae]MBM0231870.1 hypothetical protein [Micromonospora parastrephiae]